MLMFVFKRLGIHLQRSLELFERVQGYTHVPGEVRGGGEDAQIQAFMMYYVTRMMVIT